MRAKRLFARSERSIFVTLHQCIVTFARAEICRDHQFETYCSLQALMRVQTWKTRESNFHSSERLWWLNEEARADEMMFFVHYILEFPAC